MKQKQKQKQKQNDKIWVVVSRFKGDVTWTQRLAEKGHPVLVYEHIPNKTSPYNIPGNKGNEAGAYFKFIVDFYDALPKTVAFVHDHQTSWHHKGKLDDLIIGAQSRPRIHYESLNHLCTDKITGNPLHQQTIWFYEKFIQPYLGPLKENDWTHGHHCCAQFVLDKTRILKLPKTFYVDVYRWILSTSWEPKVVGHALEWTYALIFNNGRKTINKCERII